jgi:hypothetical protein
MTRNDGRTRRCTIITASASHAGKQAQADSVDRGTGLGGVHGEGEPTARHRRRPRHTSIKQKGLAV